MARKALPAHLHLVDGKSHMSKEELNRRVENEKSMDFKSDKVKPPTWLRKEAKKYFRQFVAHFADNELLKNIDVNAIALYCDALLDYIECTRIIEEDGYMLMAGQKPVAHPLLTKKNHAFQQMARLSNDFGLTPTARASLAKNITEVKDKDDNEFADRV